jgi:hypothetical protein
MLKTAMLHALTGMLLWLLWHVESAIPVFRFLRMIQPLALHLVVVGWLTQLIFGVALWMFPTWSRDQPRGPEWLAWACYGLLNAGLLLRAIAEPLNSLNPAPYLSWLLAASALAQLLAVWIFIVLVWPRVRGKTKGKVA